MLSTLSSPFILLIISVAACLLVLFTTPSIIEIAALRSLYSLELRKTHPGFKISRLAGIAVLVAFSLPLFITLSFDALKSINFFMASCLILFFFGLRDDLLSAHPLSKFAVLLFSALITTVFADIKINSFNGLFGIYNLPEPLAILITVILIMFIVNAFSLLDVVYGLVGLTGLSINGMLTILFIHLNRPVLAIIAVSLAGACLGFLRFNLMARKIFLGEGGCLLLGFVSTILCIQLLGIADKSDAGGYSFSPAIIPAILILPLYNALRLFIVPGLNKLFGLNINTSFVAHQLNMVGLSYAQTAVTLSSLNVLAVIFVVRFSKVDGMLLFAILAFLCIVGDRIISYAGEIKWEKTLNEKKRKLEVIYKGFIF